MSGESEASRLGASILACHKESKPANSIHCSGAEHSTEPGALCLPWGLPVGLEPPTCNTEPCHLLRGYPTG